MMKPQRLALVAYTLLFWLASTACAADERGEPPGGGKPPGPPPEAVAACKDKVVGAKASFTGRKGETISGICELVDGVLAVSPPAGNRPPPPRD